MKNALILHGIGGHAGIHWQGWLREKLTERGYQVLMPDLPDSKHPDRENWLKSASDLIQDIDFLGLSIIGHSLGVVTGLDLIEKEEKPINNFFSISGFGKDYGAELNSYFLKEKEIDFNKVKRLVEGAFVVYGDDDPYVPQETLKNLADELGVKPIIIEKGGHLNTNAGYTKFPLLLELMAEE